MYTRAGTDGDDFKHKPSTRGGDEGGMGRDGSRGGTGGGAGGIGSSSAAAREAVVARRQRRREGTGGSHGGVEAVVDFSMSRTACRG